MKKGAHYLIMYQGYINYPLAIGKYHHTNLDGSIMFDKYNIVQIVPGSKGVYRKCGETEEKILDRFQGSFIEVKNI
jgi:hypothetical protein